MTRNYFTDAAGTQTLTPASQAPPEVWIASATQDTSPRVGIVLSSFSGSRDDDGSPISGLTDPQPVTSDLNYAQIDGMVRKAIELGTSRGRGLLGAVGANAWVVIKPNIVSCYGLGPEHKDGGAHHTYLPGTVTDLRVVKSVMEYLIQNRRAGRITIAEGSAEWLPRQRSKSPVDGWTTDWGGAFDGLTYENLVADFSRRYPSIKFDLVDLNFDDTIEKRVIWKPCAARNPSGVYQLPKTILQCDHLITVAPLNTHIETGVSLSVQNYLGIAPGRVYGFPKDRLRELGSLDEVAVDLLSFHPDAYAIIGGSLGVEGDGPFYPGARTVHHNVIIAGVRAAAVDAVGAAVMGFDPKDIGHLTLAEAAPKREGAMGLGPIEPELIWTRGNAIQEARKEFQKPQNWRARRSGD